MRKTLDKNNILQYKIAKKIKGSGFNDYVVSLNQVLNKKNILDIKPIDYQEIYYEHEDYLCAILDNLPEITLQENRSIKSTTSKIACIDSTKT